MDQQSIACSRLICSIVNLAVRDLCHSPDAIYEPKKPDLMDLTKEKSKRKKPRKPKIIGYKVNPNSQDAFNFFFRTNVSDKYLSIIGYDPDAFKRALFNSVNDKYKSCLDERDRKNFRYNYFNWLNSVQNEKNFKLPKLLLGE